MDCSTSGFPILHHLLEHAQTHVLWVWDAIQPLLFPSPSAFNLSQHQGLFSWVSSWHQVAKVLEPQMQHQSLQWIFRVDCLALLAVCGTLKSFLQHHSSKASVLWHSAFFIVQFSHLYMTTGKAIALTIWTFVGKVMSTFKYRKELLFEMRRKIRAIETRCLLKTVLRLNLSLH